MFVDRHLSWRSWLTHKKCLYILNLVIKLAPPLSPSRPPARISQQDDINTTGSTRPYIFQISVKGGADGTKKQTFYAPYQSEESELLLRMIK